jgi:predicted phosphodiesterase
MERIIAIGDIHGQLARLEGLIERIAPSDEDRLVFLGDYIDRGEEF